MKKKQPREISVVFFTLYRKAGETMPRKKRDDVAEDGEAEVLAFWTTLMRDADADMKLRLKASELRARLLADKRLEGQQVGGVVFVRGADDIAD